MPRVSILLPTHNREDVVGLAIQSVLDQTETDFELLVVADGCTDRTVALVSAIDDPRLRVYDLPKAPHFGYASRNVALRDARGEYLAFAAHDDLLCPDHLRLLIDRLEATGSEWIYSRPLWVSTDGTIVPFATNLTMTDELEYFLTVANSIPASCVLYRRDCLDRYGYWPEDVANAADWRHWIAVIEGGRRERLAYLATPTCLHFSADWRRSRYAGMESVRTWLDIADGARWWPSALRYRIPPGVPEQRVIAAAMRAGGSAWLGELRTAVEVALDRVAWDDIRSVRPHLAAVEQALAESRETMARLTARLAAFAAEHLALAAAAASAAEARAAEATTKLECARARADVLATQTQLRVSHEQLAAAQTQLRAYQERLSLTLASTSWRITAPMRALKDAVTPRTRTSR